MKLELSVLYRQGGLGTKFPADAAVFSNMPASICLRTRSNNRGVVVRLAASQSSHSSQLVFELQKIDPIKNPATRARAHLSRWGAT